MENPEIKKGSALNFEQMVEYAKGSIVSKTLLKKESGNISLFAFDINEGLSEHTAPFDAVVQVIDGKANVIINGNPNTLVKGESIIMPANIPHALKAIEPFKMILTMIKSN
jgi:quercetin dioxygenase-like cupin family protein